MKCIINKKLIVIKKENRIYLFSYISEFCLSVFIISFVFVHVVFLPRMVPKIVLILLLLLILVSLLIRMVSFGIEKYKRTYVRGFYQLIRKDYWKAFVFEVIIAFILCFGLKIIT